jgi:peptide/nickel transport system substrate-binding protein
MTRSRACVVALVATVAIATAATAAAQPPSATAPTGQLTWGVHTTLAPTWFDPAETPGIITPFMVLYALHDALVKPMPGNAMTPSLAESWNASKDGLSYEFVLRKGVKFHNGDVMTAEDVKFSFERYRGASATDLKAKVARVEALDPHRVRFTLKRPWPDFMTFYATPATGAAWIVPKKYVEKVGEDSFKKAPVGAGPYRFVSFKPGVELTLEAFDGYWRKTPNVKTLVFRVIPDESTRLAALKRGEVDIAYSITGPLAEELKRTPGLTLTPTFFPFTIWIVFTEQWDPKSPWHDRRVRLAANLAIDRQSINQAAYLGYSKLAHSFVPQGMEYFWAPPPYTYDATPTASTRATSPRRRCTVPPSASRWSTICRPSASDSSSACWSAQPSTRSWARRSSVPSSRTAAGRRAMPPRASRSTRSPAAATRTGPTPTSTGSSLSRRTR